TFSSRICFGRASAFESFWNLLMGKQMRRTSPRPSKISRFSATSESWKSAVGQYLTASMHSRLNKQDAFCSGATVVLAATAVTPSVQRLPVRQRPRQPWRGSERPVLMQGSLMQSDKPFDIATCMYYTGLDPFTEQEVHI